MQRSPMRTGARSILCSKRMIAWYRSKAEQEVPGFRGTTAGQVFSRKTSFSSGAYASWSRVRGRASLAKRLASFAGPRFPPPPPFALQCEPDHTTERGAL